MTENAVVGSHVNFRGNTPKAKEVVQSNTNTSFYESLIHVLLREVNIYEEILEYEKKKNTAIEGQDINSLREISLKQNNLLKERESIEKDRNQKFNFLEKNCQAKKVRRLNDLLELDISQKFSDEVRKINKKMHSSIKELKELVDINCNIITYNTTFFHQLLENVVHRSVHPSTYNLNDEESHTKKAPKLSKPIFLDANC